MATVLDLQKYYANLLILQYIGKPKAYATIEALVKPVIMDQIPLSVQDAFGLETAVGVQLDIIGKYAGVSRHANTFTGPITLNDDDYRLLIKIKIIQNSSGSSLYEIQNLIHTYFSSDLRVFDYQDMRMDYTFDSAIGSHDLAEIFVRDKLLPKPMGVQLSALIYMANINNLFTFATYELGPAVNGTGFNDYTTYHTNHPWLSYSNAIIE